MPKWRLFFFALALMNSCFITVGSWRISGPIGQSWHLKLPSTSDLGWHLRHVRSKDQKPNGFEHGKKIQTNKIKQTFSSEKGTCHPDVVLQMSELDNSSLIAVWLSCAASSHSCLQTVRAAQYHYRTIRRCSIHITRSHWDFLFISWHSGRYCFFFFLILCSPIVHGVHYAVCFLVIWVLVH